MKTYAMNAKSSIIQTFLAITKTGNRGIGESGYMETVRDIGMQFVL